MNKGFRSFLLGISVPLCLLLAVTCIQVFWPGVYWRENPSAVAGGFASDLLDLCLILPLLILTTVLACRGSLGALLIWTGTLGFLAYNFVIYAFEIHFNAMFLAYCGVLGLSFYGLIGMREFLPPDAAAKVYGPGAPRKTIAVAFFLLAAMAATREVKDIVVAIRAGQMPPSIAGTAQLTDPIHVLDLCFLLPALVIAAVLLLRRKELGFTLAPILSVVLILISIEVITIIVIMVKRGLTSDLRPALSFAVAGTVFGVLLAWYLHRPRRLLVEPAGS